MRRMLWGALFFCNNSFAFAISLFPFAQVKTDIIVDKSGWEIDLNRAALNFTQSSLTNQNLYTNFSDSNLTGNSQIALQFFFNFYVNYYARRFVIFNSMVAEYGFTRIKQNDSSTITNKNLDKLFFSTDYTQRMWDFDLGFEYFEAGPYLKASYQTEFYPNPNIGRRHIVNYLFGVKIFDGRYIKNLYIDLFGEHDLNLNTQFNGLGIEIGLSLEYKLNSNLRWLYSMNFKQYLFNEETSRILPSYQLLLETRIEAKIFKSLSIAPLLRYYVLKAENINVAASNLILGVSLNFGKVLLPPRKPLKDYDFSH